MQILALDTTTREGSVAIVRDGAVIVERTGDPILTHGQRLPAEIAGVLEAARLAIGDIDRLAVAAGPGSFTGLRVGIATVQGLAVAQSLAVVPVPTLEALARSFETDRPYDAIAAWMDGQRGEIFGILYDSGGRELMPAIAGRPERVLDGWHFSADRSVVFIGDGAVRFRSIIEDRFGAAARVIQPVPLAGTIGRIACADPQRAVAPHEIVPIYVRRPDAELARERRRAAPPTAPVQNRELE